MGFSTFFRRRTFPCSPLPIVSYDSGNGSTKSRGLMTSDCDGGGLLETISMVLSDSLKIMTDIAEGAWVLVHMRIPRERLRREGGREFRKGRGFESFSGQVLAASCHEGKKVAAAQCGRLPTALLRRDGRKQVLLLCA